MEFFVPGRTEIIGNHTDHQHGRVIAAAVRQGMRAQVEPRSDGVMCLRSAGFGEIRVQLEELTPQKQDEGTPQSLLRGVAEAMSLAGCPLGGFEGVLESRLRPGGGLSSSAALAVLVGRILHGLYGQGEADALQLARWGQQAENRHFGKPSGLMDQLACAMGGAVFMDFRREEFVPVRGSFADMGLRLCLTDTGGSHARLTGAYAAIPRDMGEEAARYGQERLGYVNHDEFFAAPVREDLAYRRARHFFEEDRRVEAMRRAMERGDKEACMALMNASGRSSEELLQNIRTPEGDGRLEEGLALSAKLLDGRGAWRVHGGGFAGCVQALMEEQELAGYCAAMEQRFGPGSCMIVM